MSISIEALAMAGTDHIEWGVGFAEWELMDIGPPPPHLYADDYEDCEHVHQKGKEVEEYLKPIGSFDEPFEFPKACDQEVLTKGLEMVIMIAGINPKKRSVDSSEARFDEIRMQERPRCV